MDIKLLRFERDRYHTALVSLKARLTDLADEREEQRINELWLITCGALDRTQLTVAAAESGLLIEKFYE